MDLTTLYQMPIEGLVLPTAPARASPLRSDEPLPAGAAVGDVACPRCGSYYYRDVPIHKGESVRRDCARCGRFLDFPVWHGIGATCPPAPG
jgi:hypothetical protein